MKFNLLTFLFVLFFNIANAQNTISDFKIDLKSFETLIDNENTNDQLYKYLEKHIVSWDDEKFAELNELTGEHDLVVISPKIVINFNGSVINVETKSLESDNKIYSVTVGFRCACDWFSFKPESLNYKLIENSDNPDNRNSYFGGIQKKYKKNDKIIFYHKFHSRPYFEFSIDKQKAKPKEPSNSQEFVMQAMVKYKSSDWMKAMEFANKAIDLDKNNANAYFARALIRNQFLSENLEFKEGSQAWAIMEDYNKSISLDSTSNLANIFYQGRAELNFKLGKINKSIEDYENSLTLKPDNEKARLSLISILVDNKDVEKAQKHLQYLIDNKSTNPKIYIQSAQLKWNNGNKNEACIDFKKAKDLGLSMSGRLDLIEMAQTCR